MNSYKTNYLVYFFTYFCAQLIFIYINVYLPIYFFYILNVNRTELAFIQIFAYSALFIKPIIAIYFDKKKKIGKYIFIISTFGILLSFIFFIFNLNLLIVFGIFLGINLAFISIIDVAIDKIIVELSPSEKIKDRNASITQLGAIVGAILPNIISFIIFKDIHSTKTWNHFFLIGVLLVSPIIFIGFIIKSETSNLENNKNSDEKEINLKMILLICLILFLFYGERIYEYPLEPWILKKYGEEYLSLILILFIILIFLNALGILIAGIISNKFDRKRILLVSTFCYGILLIIVPYTDMVTFFILFGVMQIFSGFIIINLISLMIKYSQKKVLYFQIMATFVLLSFVVFIPLGTFLSSFIEVEILIIIAGILKIVSLIPIYFLETKSKKK